MTDRRREERQPTEGSVQLEVDAPLPRSIAGTLVDVSPSGLRVRHGDMSLATGQRVRYSHAAGAGTAVVMWTRVFEGAVESGLYTRLAE